MNFFNGKFFIGLVVGMAIIITGGFFAVYHHNLQFKISNSSAAYDRDSCMAECYNQYVANMSICGNQGKIGKARDKISGNDCYKNTQDRRNTCEFVCDVAYPAQKRSVLSD